MNERRNQQQDDCTQESRFANCFEIGYNAFEFVIAFSQRYGEDDKKTCYTSIITSPIYAKVLFEMLQKSLHDYEQSFGEIEEKSLVTL